MPLLLISGLGLWLWRTTDLFPRTRQILWVLPDDYAQLTQVDLQIHDAQGVLLVRKQLAWQRGAPSELTDSLTLPAGDYQAWVFLRRAPDRPEQALRQPVHVGADDMVVVSLRGVR